MKKNKIIDYFQFNLLRLKKLVNNNVDMKDEIYLIMFNHCIDSFPNDPWFAIKDSFLNHLEYRDPNWILIYTIIAYKIGPSFTEASPIFIEDLVNNLITYKIKPLKLHKCATFFTEKPLSDTITYALEMKGIPPKYIIRLVLENFDPAILNHQTKHEIYATIKNFISEFSFQIFDGNYSFFNIYKCLKRIWDNYLILELPSLNFQDIELLLSFNELPSEELKRKAERDFAAIEKKDASISQKFSDCLLIITKYSYELPKYVPQLNLKS